MGHDQTTIVQNVVTDKTVDEISDLFFKLGRLSVELLQRFGEAMSDLDVAAAQFAHQFRIVIARHGERGSRFRHAHDQLQNFRHLWPTIDEVAEKHCFAALRMMRVNRAVSRSDRVAELRQKRMQLVVAAMNVANDVEWSMIVFAIVPERLALNHYLVDFGGRREFMNVTKAFAFQIANRPAQLVTLLPDHVRTEVAIRTLSISILANAIGQVEHERDGKHVIFTR